MTDGRKAPLLAKNARNGAPSGILQWGCGPPATRPNLHSCLEIQWSTFSQRAREMGHPKGSTMGMWPTRHRLTRPIMFTALTRAVSSRINECELTFIERQAIDVERAVRQHRNYQQLLRSLGLNVVELPADDRCPDCCFIEDTALVLDELAIATRPGSDARRAEVAGVLPIIAKHRK